MATTSASIQQGNQGTQPLLPEEQAEAAKKGLQEDLAAFDKTDEPEFGSVRDRILQIIPTRQSLDDVSNNLGDLGSITISSSLEGLKAAAAGLSASEVADIQSDPFSKGTTAQLPGGNVLQDGQVIGKFDSVRAKQNEQIGEITRGALGKLNAGETSIFNRGERDDLDLKFKMDEAVRQHGRKLKQAKSDQRGRRDSLASLEKDVAAKKRDLKGSTTLGARNQSQDRQADFRLSRTILELEANIESKRQEVKFGRDDINDGVLSMDATLQQFNAQRGRGVDGALLEIQARREAQVTNFNPRGADVLRAAESALKPLQDEDKRIVDEIGNQIEAVASSMAKKLKGSFLFPGMDGDGIERNLIAIAKSNPLDARLGTDSTIGSLQLQLARVRKKMKPAMDRRDEVMGITRDIETAKSEDNSNDEILQRAPQIARLKLFFPTSAVGIDDAIRSGNFQILDDLDAQLSSGEILTESEAAVPQ